MKKKITYIVIGVVVIAGAFVAYKALSSKSQQIELTTEPIGRATISNTVTATGTLEASVTVEVGTQVSGKINNLYVDYNSTVKKGQLIAVLDTESLQSMLESSKATLDQAQAEYEYQKANYERYQKLIAKKLIAQQDFDAAEYSYKAAKASLSIAQASYAKNKTNLDYAYIYSPIDGIVLEKNVEEGETVAASFSTPTLFTIANDLTQMEIEADVDEADIGQLKLDQRVEFTVDAYPYKTFNGVVKEIRLMPVENSNVITYTVIIDAPNPDKILMPGMTANVTFYVTEKKDILVVPNTAVLFTPDFQLLDLYMEQHPEIKMDMKPAPPSTSETEKTVWIKTDDSIYPQTVKVGETDEINYEIISGLSEGTQVITSLASNNPVKQGDMEEQGSRSPFMPTPPGSKSSKK